jgi:hypothetical protein
MLRIYFKIEEVRMELMETIAKSTFKYSDEQLKDYIS